MGIYSFNSSFIVNKYNDTYAGHIIDSESYVNNLYYGIKALGIDTEKTFECNESNFNYCFRGVYLSGIDYAQIFKNSFYIRGSEENWESRSYAIYTDYCTKYKIDENIARGTSEYFRDIGIIINNSGEDLNMVYKNYLQFLYIGILAQNSNRSYDPLKGLKIKCNDFFMNKNDLAVTVDDDPDPFPDPNTQGISKYQGIDDGSVDPNNPAGNLFTANENFVLMMIDNEAKDINYYHHEPTSKERVEPKADKITQETVSPQNTDIDWVEEITCPPRILDAGNDTIRMEILKYNDSINTVNNELALLIDGGDTEETQFNIEISQPPDAMDLRDELMDESPYLSDTVMIDAINKEDVLEEAMVRDILVANPQSAKSKSVMDEVYNRNNPLPGYMIDDIIQGKSMQSAKELRECKLSKYYAERQYRINELVKRYRNNNTPSDSLITLLLTEMSINSRYEIGFRYIKENDTTAASNTIDSIPILFDLNNRQYNEYQRYLNYFNVYKNCNMNFEGMLYLDTTHLNVLLGLSSTYFDMPGAYSRNLLRMIDEIDYEEPIILPDPLKQIGNYNILDNEKKNNPLIFYPNPANDYFVIDYSIEQNDVIELRMEIIDIRGIVVKSVLLDKNIDQCYIDTRNINSGNYLCRLILNNKVLQSTKITIL